MIMTSGNNHKADDNNPKDSDKKNNLLIANRKNRYSINDIIDFSYQYFAKQLYLKGKK